MLASITLKCASASCVPLSNFDLAALLLEQEGVRLGGLLAGVVRVLEGVAVGDHAVRESRNSTFDARLFVSSCGSRRLRIGP
jgi:hypothetical protein